MRLSLLARACLLLQVETIGDSFMVVSGMAPARPDHARAVSLRKRRRAVNAHTRLA